jgi:acyl-CoA synthetase (NDP forming)
MDELAAEEVGVARVVSYGNKADVNECDLLEFLSADEETGAVVMYLESVDEGRRFVDAARRCAGKKPVAALKVGHTEAAATAARSHTGALAGRYEVYRAAFRKAGVMELRGYEDFLVACKVLAGVEPAAGGRVMIITDGGGMGVTIADECVDLGLDVSPLSAETAAELRAVLPPVCSIANPMDLTGSVTDRHFSEALARTLDGDDFDLAIVASLWGPPGLTERLAEMVAAKKEIMGKPVIVCTPGGRYTREMAGLFRRRGLPVFFSPGEAARAASLLCGAGTRE